MKKEIENALEILSEGGIILYPSDTIWGIGCDATNDKAVKKIYELKKRAKSKALIILIAEYANMYKLLDQVSPNAYRYMHESKPTTVIFDNIKNISNHVLAKDGSAAVRLVKDKFCENLILKLGQPLVSTSANLSGGKNPKNFNDISIELRDNVDYIVNLRREEIMDTPSSIIKLFSNGKTNKIR
ncbi:MAG: threonylcarbamoyl-AMP synthase [Flavobacteriales bacterium]|nr:threonylcarbamoyl-AMP synthase [Flavobacteriales bacterium]OUW94286.1 MAG: threonylcarbamoyl-AMP synthase [Flavobacteriales bacterium TMED228]|tara:strand:- start:176 stop:730 length:555 start_codon:yes stop_codon:yes gene_type:complete